MSLCATSRAGLLRAQLRPEARPWTPIGGLDGDAVEIAHSAALGNSSVRSTGRFARRMKRRFHRHDFLVVSVKSLHRYRQLHELACLVNGDGGDDFRQGADPRLHKSAETGPVAIAKVRRDNDFASASRLQVRIWPVVSTVRVAAIGIRLSGLTKTGVLLLRIA